MSSKSLTKAKKAIKESRYRSPTGREYSPAEMAQRKAIFFEPVTSKEELRLFLKAFFNIELPDHLVDEESTMTPMEFVWEVYNTMGTNVGPKNYVVASSRNSSKTLCSAIIHFLSMIHWRRQCLHIASIKPQAKVCMRYMDSFCRLPEVAEYFESDNVEERRLSGLPANSFTTKNSAEVSIVAATLKGTNARRANCVAGTSKVSVPAVTESAKNHAKYAYRTAEGIWRDITERGLKPVILTYNEKTQELELDTVVAACRHMAPRRLRIYLNDIQYIECTDDHRIAVDLDENCKIVYKKAGKLSVGDTVFQTCASARNRSDVFPEPSPSIPYAPFAFNEGSYTLEDILVGAMLGDGALINRHKMDHTSATFLMQKSAKAREYMKWFCGKLREFGIDASFRPDAGISGYTGQPLDKITTKSHPLLTAMYKKWYPKHSKIVPEDVVLNKNIFTQWVMDDGFEFRVISSCGFSESEHTTLVRKINDLFGFECARLGHDNKSDGRSYLQIDLVWPYEHKAKLIDLYQYLHPDYYYKIPNEPKPCVQCGKLFYFVRNENVCESKRCQTLRVSKVLQKKTTTKIEEVVINRSRGMYVYDLQMEHNHNFVADTFLVHNCLIKDEIDLTPREILTEVAGVLDPTLDEHQFDPVVIGLSSRKTNDGPLQDDLDESARDAASGKPCKIKTVKFSMVDWMEKCTDHGPSIGMVYVCSDNLRMVWDKEEYSAIPDTEKGRYRGYEMYQKCKECPALLVCLGRATKQVNTSPRLRTKEFVGTVLNAVKDSNVLISQFLNWRPETTGVVFRVFDVMRHCTDLLGMWMWVSGKEWTSEQPVTLQFLAEWMRANGWFFGLGVDWGYTDPASGGIIAYNEKQERACVLKAITMTGYANQQWAEFLGATIPAYLMPDIVCPDTEDPASPGYFRKMGLRARKEKPKKIATGVSQIRGLLWDPGIQKERFKLLVDGSDPHLDGMQTLIWQFLHWKHRRTPLGNWNSAAFEEGNDHCLDFCRYVLDLFLKSRPKASITVDTIAQKAKEYNSKMNASVPPEVIETYTKNGSPFAFDHAAAMKQIEAAGMSHLVTELTEAPISEKKKARVSFHW